jgi:hypothetical protein
MRNKYSILLPFIDYLTVLPVSRLHGVGFCGDFMDDKFESIWKEAVVA